MNVFDVQFADLPATPVKFWVVAPDADEAYEIASWWWGLTVKSVTRGPGLSRSMPVEKLHEYKISYVVADKKHDVRVLGGLTSIGVVMQQARNNKWLVLGMVRVATFRNLIQKQYKKEDIKNLTPVKQVS